MRNGNDFSIQEIICDLENLWVMVFPEPNVILFGKRHGFENAVGLLLVNNYSASCYG